MTLNPVFEEDKQNPGENEYTSVGVASPRNSKVRPDFVIYWS